MTTQNILFERKLPNGLSITPASQTYELKAYELYEQLHVYMEKTVGKIVSVQFLSEEGSGHLLAKIMLQEDKEILMNLFSITNQQLFARELIGKLLNISNEQLGVVTYNKGLGSVQVQINQPRHFVCIRNHAFRAIFTQFQGEEANCDYMIRVEPADAIGTREDMFEHDLLEITPAEYANLQSIKSFPKSFEQNVDKLIDRYIGNKRVRLVLYLGRNEYFRNVFVRSPLMKEVGDTFEVFNESEGYMIECSSSSVIDLEEEDYHKLLDIEQRYGRNHSDYQSSADEVIKKVLIKDETIYFSNDDQVIRRYTKNELIHDISKSGLLNFLELSDEHPMYEEGIEAVISLIGEQALGISPSVFLESLKEHNHMNLVRGHVQAHLQKASKRLPNPDQIMIIKQVSSSMDLLASALEQDELFMNWLEKSGLTDNFTRCLREIAFSFSHAIDETEQ